MNYQIALDEIDMLRSKLKDISDAALILLDHPVGCRCGNNGGGDCEWCLRAENLRDVLTRHHAMRKTTKTQWTPKQKEIIQGHYR